MGAACRADSRVLTGTAVRRDALVSRRRPWLLVRLHGLKHETWNKKRLTSAVERFNYDYVNSLAELDRSHQRCEGPKAVLNKNHEDPDFADKPLALRNGGRPPGAE